MKFQGSTLLKLWNGWYLMLLERFILRNNSKKSIRNVFSFLRKKQLIKLEQKRFWLLKRLALKISQEFFNSLLNRKVLWRHVINQLDPVLHRLRGAKVQDFALRSEPQGTLLEKGCLMSQFPKIQFTFGRWWNHLFNNSQKQDGKIRSG